MSLLPSRRPDVDASQEGDVRLLGFDEDASESVLDAISSDTARELLGEIHRDPGTPSELAQRTDTTLQNVSYHLKRLEEADLIRVAGTQYSDRGREMDVYAPADEPLVVFVGTEQRKRSLRRLLQRFIGAVGVLGVLSVILHAVIEGDLPYFDFAGTGGAGGGDVVEPTMPIATAIFLGGITMLTLLVVWWYWRPHRRALTDRLLATPWVAGRDLAVSRRIATVAAGVFAVLVVAWSGALLLHLDTPLVSVLGPALGLALLILGGGGAALQAYYNDGLLVSWAVAWTVVAGLMVGFVWRLVGEGGLAGLVVLVGYTVLVGAIGALILGTPGYLVGIGVRYITS